MSRIIPFPSRLSAAQTAACVGSLFALELMCPSREIYLNVGALGNALILRNDLDQFSALFPGQDISQLTLATALSLLAERGTEVHLAYAADRSIEEEFLYLLSPRVLLRRASQVHHCGIFTERFCLRGSLSFASFGVDITSDRMELSTEAGEVTRALLSARQYWEDLE